MPRSPHRSDAFCYGRRHHAVCALAFHACLLMLLTGNSARAAVAPGVLSAQVSSGIPSEDRKSTRLNSSHLGISYAVFCLKKKKKKNTTTASYYRSRFQL